MSLVSETSMCLERLPAKKLMEITKELNAGQGYLIPQRKKQVEKCYAHKPMPYTLYVKSVIYLDHFVYVFSCFFRGGG